MSTLVQGQFGHGDERSIELYGSDQGARTKVNGDYVGDHENLTYAGPKTIKGTVEDFGVVLEDAYDKLFQVQDEADALEFARLLGVADPDLKTLYVRTKEGGKSTYALNGGAMLAAIGDVKDPGGHSASKREDAKGESSIKMIIATLLYHQDYSEEALANLDANKRPRLNVLADEEEQSLEYLELAKLLADKVGVDVRIMATPSANHGVNTQTDMAVIDLQTMELVQNPDDPGAVQLKYDAVVNGAVRTMKVPVTDVLGEQLRATTDANGKPLMAPNQYEDASAPLIPGQTIRGVNALEKDRH